MRLLDLVKRFCKRLRPLAAQTESPAVKAGLSFLRLLLLRSYDLNRMIAVWHKRNR
jgi:hypothetical protein